jgi:chromosome segregation ATPase
MNSDTDTESSNSANSRADALRRRIDAEMAETLREYRQRVIDTSERLTRIDESLIYLKSEYSSGRESRITIQEQQTVIAERLTGLSTRFIEHIEEATGERALLQALTTQVTSHSERLTGLERFQIAVWSIAGTIGAVLIGWALNSLHLVAAK